MSGTFGLETAETPTGRVELTGVEATGVVTEAPRRAGDSENETFSFAALTRLKGAFRDRNQRSPT